MIQRRSDREPGPGRPPATRNASRERGEAQQPAGHPGLAAFGRPVSTACASDAPVPQTGEGSALPEHQDTAGTPGLAQNLPALVLEKIFSYLPSHALSQCARVCHHWHACLPALQARIAFWLQENPLSCQADSHLARGFSSRTQSFLQDGNSPFLLPLMQLQQQENRSAAVRQDRAQEHQPPGVCDLQSSLVHAALDRQLSLTPELRLRPAPLDWPAGGVSHAGVLSSVFSPCSRWLAISCQFQTESSTHLRLYGWENGVWQRCPLASEPDLPVETLRFTSMPPDTLLGTRGVNVMALSKASDNHTWHGALVCSIPQSDLILQLFSMANGDQIIITKNSQGGLVPLLALFCRRTGDGRSWNTLMTVRLERQIRDAATTFHWAEDRQSCQLALTTTRQLKDPDHIINEINIWHTGLNSSRPEPWNCQHAVLPLHNISLTGIVYSPGGHYLLAVLSDSQARLWKLDAQHRLQEQLVVPSCHNNLERSLKQQVAFRSDEKQLAVSSSLWQAQIFYCDANDRWQHGPRLEMPPASYIPANDNLRHMRLSSSGRLLARKTDLCLNIWYQNPTEGWQHVVQRQWKPGQRYPPQFCLLQPGDLVCTSVENPGRSLQVYGPDSQGKLVTKSCMPIKASLYGPDAASPDGLSLLLGAGQTLPIPLQLVSSEEEQNNNGCRLL
ncbi:MAG: F-box-like domain-containing protein [Kistimonas sp.]|nr:F-box-like domain-containing protein [Kistimonas sp.]